jgi:hypothetical protein
MAARFRPPRDVPFIGADALSQARFNSWLRVALSEIAEDLAQISAVDPPGTVAQERIELPAGGQRRVSPSSAGLAVVLPCPQPDNAGAISRIFIESPTGQVTVVAAPGTGPDGKIFQPTINGSSRATFSLPGVVTFHSNGSSDWTTQVEAPSETAASAATTALVDSLAAQYVLGAAHPSLPDGRVATDSTEIDAVLTSAGVISWALNVASVVLGKLQNIATQRLIGRNTAGSGAPEQITVHQALDWIVSDEWGFDGSDDAVSLGNVYQKERTDSFSVSAWVKTGLPAITGITDFMVLSNVDSTANNRGWSLYIHNDGKPHLKLTNVINTNDLDISGDAVANDGQLHHIVATYGGGSSPASVQLYMDGVLLVKTTILTSLTQTIVAAGNALRIGRFGASSSFFFPGVISYVSVWGSALSAANVTTLYNSGVRGNEAAVGTPQSLWKLDATDVTGASGIVDYGSGSFEGTTEGGLTNGVRPGSVAVRGATDWDVLQPGARGAALLSTGGNTVPSFGALDLSAIEPQSANSLPANATASQSVMSALSVGTNTVVGRVAGNIVAAALVNAQVDAAAAIALSKLATQSANTVVANATSGTAVPTAVAVGTNTVLGRVAGNIVAATLVNAQIATNTITATTQAQMVANTVKSNATAGTANESDLAVGTNTVVGRVAGNIVAAALVNAQVDAAAAIALSKLATQAADSFVGNFTNAVAVPTARAGTSVAGTGLTYTTGGTLSVSVPLSDGDKGDITVASSGASWTLDAGTVTPAKLAVLASSIGAVFTIFVTATAGTPGSADDVTIYSSNAPFAFRILDVTWLDSTAIALATVQLRDTSGGGGSALSSALTAAVTGTARNNDTQTRTVAANGSVFLRRSDQGVAGDLVILAVRT